MKRGRKKNPENVTPGSVPAAVPGKVLAPAYLDAAAREIFDRLARTLADMKILTSGDVDILASLAEVKALGLKHKARVDGHGATQKTTTGREVFSGDYIVWRDTKNIEQKLLNDLGLTPASRTRVAAAVAEEVDEFAQFMARRARSDGVKPKAEVKAQVKAKASPKAEKAEGRSVADRNGG